MSPGSNSHNPAAPKSTEEPGHRRDPLHEHSKVVVVAMCILAIGLLVASLLSDASEKLPTAAFGWELGLDIIRAAVAFAVIAGFVIVLFRGWGGIWPQRLSTTGIDYKELSEGSLGLAKGEAKIRQLQEELGGATKRTT